MRKKNNSSHIQAGEVSWALRALVQSNANVRLELAKRLEMGITDLQAIEHLMGDPAMGPAELSRKLGIKSASVTALLDRLEGMGHLTRIPNVVDRRKTGLVVSSSAVETVIRHLQPIVSELDAVAEGFSETERKVILRYLTKITEIWSTHFSSER